MSQHSMLGKTTKHVTVRYDVHTPIRDSTVCFCTYVYARTFDFSRLYASRFIVVRITSTQNIYGKACCERTLQSVTVRWTSEFIPQDDKQKQLSVIHIVKTCIYLCKLGTCVHYLWKNITHLYIIQHLCKHSIHLILSVTARYMQERLSAIAQYSMCTYIHQSKHNLPVFLGHYNRYIYLLHLSHLSCTHYYFATFITFRSAQFACVFMSGLTKHAQSLSLTAQFEEPLCTCCYPCPVTAHVHLSVTADSTVCTFIYNRIEPGRYIFTVHFIPDRMAC